MNATLQTLATVTRSELEEKTVSDLRDMARGNLTGYSKLRKADLIDALLAEGEKLRAVAESWNERKAAEEVKAVSEDLGEYCQLFFRQFKAIVEANLDLSTGEVSRDVFPQLSGLATQLVSYLDSIPGQQPHGGIADSTKLRYRSEVTSALKNAIEAEQGSFLKPAMESAASILDAVLGQALSNKYQAKKTEYKQTIAKRKEEKTEIDPSGLIAMAESILINVETLNKSDWKLVSVALAVVTGRRMAEVHNESTQFEMVDDQTLLFTGQLKAKGSAKDYYAENPSYKIPCLVYPALAVVGHNWLREHGKLCDSPKQAHNRFSRYLAEIMKSIRSELGIDSDKLNYKALRAIYGMEAFKRSGADDEAAYLAKILGHGRGDLQAGNERISDFLTPQSYNSDWKVKS